MITRQAYTEVYYLINEMSDEMRKKIPLNIINAIKEKMDKNYKFNVENEDIEDLVLLEDTEKILSVLYTDYIASEEEKNIIKNKEKLIAEKRKAEIPKVQVKEILFEKKVDDSNALIRTENKKWHTKIFEWLKSLIKTKGET